MSRVSFAFKDLPDTYNYVVHEASDKRVSDWWLMNNPWPCIGITLVYIYISYYLGPSFMSKRKALSLRPVLITYNFSMVALSAYMFYEFGKFWFSGEYSVWCQPVDFSTTPKAMAMLRITYIYFLSKFVEFFDTFFFLLRRKFAQVTFLHVFHHAVMVLHVWLLVKYCGGGHGTFHALINSFIHFVMYTYYGLAAFGPEMQKYLWWKRYLTKIQIVQFVIVFFHAAQLFFNGCDYPWFAPFIFCIYSAIFLILFANFYIQAQTPS